MLQNPHFDGTETNQPNKPVLVNEIIANWKDVVKALTDLYNKTHRGCELKNVFEGFISGVDEAPLPADDESVNCVVEEVEKMMRR